MNRYLWKLHSICFHVMISALAFWLAHKSAGFGSVFMRILWFSVWFFAWPFLVLYTLCLKKVPTFNLYVSLSNLNQFSQYLNCWKAYEICYKTYTTLPSHLRGGFQPYAMQELRIYVRNVRNAMYAAYATQDSTQLDMQYKSCVQKNHKNTQI